MQLFSVYQLKQLHCDTAVGCIPICSLGTEHFSPKHAGGRNTRPTGLKPTFSTSYIQLSNIIKTILKTLITRTIEAKHKPTARPCPSPRTGGMQTRTAGQISKKHSHTTTFSVSGNLTKQLLHANVATMPKQYSGVKHMQTQTRQSIINILPADIRTRLLPSPEHKLPRTQTRVCSPRKSSYTSYLIVTL